MENNETAIEMSDSAIGSTGAKCVGAAVAFCTNLKEMRLSNCEIKDMGAKALFDEIVNSKSVTLLDLSRNPLTEKCFDSLIALLNKNTTIKSVMLYDINVKNKLAWTKLKAHADRVKH